MASLPKLLAAILVGRSGANVRFTDLRRLLTALGFVERIKGGHHIFHRGGVVEIINLQPADGGKAKPYRVEQVRQLIARYHLTLPEQTT